MSLLSYKLACKKLILTILYKYYSIISKKRVPINFFFFFFVLKQPCETEGQVNIINP